MSLTVKLESDQLDELAERVVRKLRESGGNEARPKTVIEVARALGRSPQTIRRRIAAGRIRHCPGDTGRVPHDEFQRLLES